MEQQRPTLEKKLSFEDGAKKIQEDNILYGLPSISMHIDEYEESAHPKLAMLIAKRIREGGSEEAFRATKFFVDDLPKFKGVNLSEIASEILRSPASIYVTEAEKIGKVFVGVELKEEDKKIFEEKVKQGQEEGKRNSEMFKSLKE